MLTYLLLLDNILLTIKIYHEKIILNKNYFHGLGKDILMYKTYKFETCVPKIESNIMIG